MSDSYRTTNKLRSHVAYLCRLSGTVLFIVFGIGCILTIFDRSLNDSEIWRINFQVQLMERSHLPLISIALYALSLSANEERKYHASIYWKRLTIFSVLFVILYLGALANSSYRLYSLMRFSYQPIVSYEENLKILRSEVSKMSSISEANKALENTFKRSGKKNPVKANEDLPAIKNIIMQEEEKNLFERHKRQKKQYLAKQRSMQFESIRYTIYSLIFIIFYSNLTLFFNRLYKSN